MLQPRIIPILLLQNDAIVKTIKFRKPTYIGDPVNTVNLYNQFEVDELIILDINASARNKRPNFSLIEELCAETFMPLTYGGGINCLEDMRLLFKLGVEKIVLGKAAYLNKNLITEAANQFGSQAIVASVDYKNSIWGNRKVFVQNARIKVKICIEKYIEELINLGVGEILLNAVDRDGTMEGYDYEFVKYIAQKITIPVIAAGGAKNKFCIPKLIHYSGASAAAASSIFIYQNQARGVLINFPEREEIDKLLQGEPK